MVQTVLPEAASPFVGIFQQDSPSRLRVFDIRTGRQTGQTELAHSFLQRKCLSPDGRLFAWYAPGQHNIQIQSTAGSKQVIELGLPTQFASINYLQFAMPDRLLVGSANDNKLSVWDIKARKRLHGFDMPSGTDEKLIALSHGGIYLAMASRSPGRVQIYDLRNGALAGTLDIAQSPADAGTFTSTESIAFSLDGTQLAALQSQGASYGLVVLRIKGWQTDRGLCFRQTEFPK
jgi:WD40 repeat protein